MNRPQRMTSFTLKRGNNRYGGNTSNEEKRVALRVHLTMQVKIKKGRIFAKDDLNAIIRNPSKTGMAVQTSMAIPVGSLISILVDTGRPGKPNICELKGEVVWSRPKTFKLLNHCGIKIDPKSKGLEDWKVFIQRELNISKHISHSK